MKEKMKVKLFMSIFILFFAVLTITGCFSSVTDLPKASTYNVNMNITNEDNEPISGAEVNLDGENKISGEKGTISFRKNNGTYPCIIKANGYHDNRSDVIIDGKDEIVNVIMLKIPPSNPSNYSVIFNIVNEENSPISEAEVILDGSTQFTGSDGITTFNKPNGTYSYSINADGYEEQKGNILIENSNVSENTTLIKEMTLVFEEDFTGLTELPFGWSTYVSSQYTEGPHWTINQTNYAGGNSPEVSLNQGTQVLTYRLISDSIEIPNYDEVLLKFKHMSNDFNGTYDYKILVQISTDGGNSWENTEWSIVNPYSNIGPETVSISLDNYTGQNVKIGWTFVGFSWAVHYWSIDDIEVKGR